MENYFKQDLQPGDDVVYVEPGHYKGLKVGRIVRLTAQKIVIGFPNPREPGKIIETDKVDVGLAYKIPPRATVGNPGEFEDLDGM